MKITLTRAEGLIAECDKPVEVESFARANEILAQWARTAPKGGSYHKCDFAIQDFIAFGISYEGRYDLHHLSETTEEGTPSPDLKKHIEQSCRWTAKQLREQANAWFFAYMTPEEKRDALAFRESVLASLPSIA